MCSRNACKYGVFRPFHPKSNNADLVSKSALRNGKERLLWYNVTFCYLLLLVETWCYLFLPFVTFFTFSYFFYLMLPVVVIFLPSGWIIYHRSQIIYHRPFTIGPGFFTIAPCFFPSGWTFYHWCIIRCYSPVRLKPREGEALGAEYMWSSSMSSARPIPSITLPPSSIVRNVVVCRFFSLPVLFVAPCVQLLLTSAE